MTGALLGPMILSALAVIFNLHVAFIGAELPQTTESLASMSRTVSLDSVQSRFTA